MKRYKILSYGFTDFWIKNYFDKILDSNIFDINHFILGENDYIYNVCKRNDCYFLVDIKNYKKAEIDYKLISKIENKSGMTISSIINCDRVLKLRDYNESFKYLFYLAEDFIKRANKISPNLVIGYQDNAHSLIINMCCKFLNIPWIYQYYLGVPPNIPP